MILSIKLDKSQRKELGKYLLDISKIVLVSFVIKLFEPGVLRFTSDLIFVVILGLTTSILIAMIALYLLKE